MDSSLLAGISEQLAILHYELVAAQLVRSGRAVTLQVFIDKEGGVDIDDCVAASRQLSVWLDVENPIAGAYRLEVSSPGLDRPLTKLTDFQRFLGQECEIELHVLQDGRRRWKGVIKNVQEDVISLQTELGEANFPWSSIYRARLVPQWS